LPRICVEASITVTDEAENAADMDGCILSAVMTADRINKELFTADLPAVIVLLPRINIFEKGEDFLLPSCIVKEGKIVMNSGLTTFLRLDVRSLVHVLSTCKCLRGQWRQTLLSPEETFARLRIIEKRPQQMNMLDACKRDLDAVPSHLKEWLTAVVVDVVGDPEHHSLTPYFDVIVTEVDVCKQHAKHSDTLIRCSKDCDTCQEFWSSARDKDDLHKIGQTQLPFWSQKSIFELLRHIVPQRAIKLEQPGGVQHKKDRVPFDEFDWFKSHIEQVLEEFLDPQLDVLGRGAVTEEILEAFKDFSTCPEVAALTLVIENFREVGEKLYKQLEDFNDTAIFLSILKYADHGDGE